MILTFTGSGEKVLHDGQMEYFIGIILYFLFLRCKEFGYEDK